jgi:8-oxo-dGTP pyrophosphatase MutT (NUDIX family)
VSGPFDAKSDLTDAPRVLGSKLRPKDAATLILVRREGPEPSVLMGRRAQGHVFMASKWVFPGGRVDRADYRVASASELDPRETGLLSRGARPSLARALALAAVRETFEETGLLLARPAPPRPGAGVWREFLAQGALPDLAPLAYVARAITPPGRARRFDARFFMAEATALLSLDRSEGCGELDEIAWIELSKTGDLDLPTITRFVLSEVKARMAQPKRPIPFVRFTRGEHAIDYLDD